MLEASGEEDERGQSSRGRGVRGCAAPSGGCVRPCSRCACSWTEARERARARTTKCSRADGVLAQVHTDLSPEQLLFPTQRTLPTSQHPSRPAPTARLSRSPLPRSSSPRPHPGSTPRFDGPLCAQYHLGERSRPHAWQLASPPRGLAQSPSPVAATQRCSPPPATASSVAVAPCDALPGSCTCLSCSVRSRGRVEPTPDRSRLALPRRDHPARLLL